MITARYGDYEHTFIIVTFENGRTTTVPCDPNNALYAKIIDMGIQVQPYEDDE